MPLDQPASLLRQRPQRMLAENSDSPQAPARPLAWHIITCEYPPQTGGVSDYTYAVAAGLAAEGDEVHVWCPANPAPPPRLEGVEIHRELGHLTPSDLARTGEKLDEYPSPRRILVQWVPHGFGYGSMNLAFCWWLRNRAARHGDRVEIMLHEPFLPFRASSFRQSAAALVHRLMTVVLLRATERVWMSIPGWESRWRPYAAGRKIPFQWLPIPSGIPVLDNPAGAEAVRRKRARGGGFLIGHFGTFGPPVTNLLEPILFALAAEPVSQRVLLMGRGSEEFRQVLIRKDPRLAEWLEATGPLPPDDLSLHVAACDVLIQPYPDGVSSRRTSFMAGLSHGKPVVTTTGELTEDCWAASGVVPIAQAGDVNRFVALVDALRDQPEERYRLGQEARILYRDRFDIQHVIATLRAAAWKPSDEGTGSA
jgi:glycosyltransferase involved in cell wall biosynthesis